MTLTSRDCDNEIVLWGEVRDVDSENASFVQGAFDIDGPLVGFDDVFNDGEAQTGAGDIPGFLILDTIEPGKHTVQVLRGDAPSGICHNDAEVTVLEG